MFSAFRTLSTSAHTVRFPAPGYTFPSTAVKSDTGRYGASQGRFRLGGTSRLRQSRPNPPMGMPADRLPAVCRFSGFLPLPCHDEADRKPLFLKAGSVCKDFRYSDATSDRLL